MAIGGGVKATGRWQDDARYLLGGRLPWIMRWYDTVGLCVGCSMHQTRGICMVSHARVEILDSLLSQRSTPLSGTIRIIASVCIDNEYGTFYWIGRWQDTSSQSILKNATEGIRYAFDMPAYYLLMYTSLLEVR